MRGPFLLWEQNPAYDDIKWDLQLPGFWSKLEEATG